MPAHTLLFQVAIALVATTTAWADNAETSELRIVVRDPNGQLVPCRIHLRDAEGEPVLAPGLPAWRDHFVCPGDVALELPPGNYHYEIERGPEHERAFGDVDLSGDQTIDVTIERVADMPALGWYAGDMHIHRRPEEAPLLLAAEDLHVGQVITWWNTQNLLADNLPSDPLTPVDRTHAFHMLAGEDERGGGALLYFNMDRPIDITQGEREYPSSLAYLSQAREEYPHCWVDIEKPFWWDVPLWIASGQVDSIGIANNHMCRSQMYEDEAWGRARDTARLPDPLGNGYWTQEIYYHVLNCGLRLPPSAGSASGVLPNPVGYNRVYVHTGNTDRLDYEAWFDGLRSGRCFVTNGPLLQVTADGELPGHEFDVDSEMVTLDIHLTSQDRIPALEVIQNGKVVTSVPCDDMLEQSVTLDLPLTGPGWFLVRAIADNDETFRFASTAPFYVGSPNEARISRGSTQFFIDWVDERRAALEEALDDETQRDSVLEYADRAQEFWSNMNDYANAD
jgi:hypothetical protein